MNENGNSSDSVKLEEEQATKFEKLLDMLDDNDDVMEVYHNWEE